jgi:glycosyltransferase involved in cell wall biosynthesis
MNNATPFFSVIIPTYNHADFLHSALESVLKQTFSNFEVIVVDNFSDDHTEEIVSNFNDTRIKLLKIHNNGVIASSRNLGIKEAKGVWIAFLDSDDKWYPTRLSTIKEYSLIPKYDVISTNEVIVVYGDGEKSVLRYGPYVDNFYKIMLLYGNRLSTSATVVKKAFLNKNKLQFCEAKEFITVEDYDLWLKLALAKANFKFIDKVEGEFTIHNDNNSLRNEIHKGNLKGLIKRHILFMQNFESDKLKLWNKVDMCFRLADTFNLLKNFRFYQAFLEISNLKLHSMIFIIVYFSNRLSQKLHRKGKRI